MNTYALAPRYWTKILEATCAVFSRATGVDDDTRNQFLVRLIDELLRIEVRAYIHLPREDLVTMVKIMIESANTAVLRLTGLQLNTDEEDIEEWLERIWDRL